MLLLYSTNPRLKVASEDLKGCLAPTRAVEVGAGEVSGATEFGTVASDMQEQLALPMEDERLGQEG